MPQAQVEPAFAARFAVYLRERFPPLQYAVGLGAFVWAALAYALALRGESGLPPAYPALAAFAVTFLLFLQLRILDEFKDFAEDAQFRPYRPVPRGLISLRSLWHVWLAAFALQAVLAASLGLVPLGLLLAILAYSGLMRAEFFARAWLKRHALAYLVSHMVIVPLIALFIVASTGMPASGSALASFLAFCYLNFCVFEIGRKIKAPAEERTGVETYSALWGPRRAVAGWLGVLWGAAAMGWAAAAHVGIGRPYAAIALIAAAVATALGRRFLSRPDHASGKVLETLSGVWQLAVHIAFGAAIALRP